MTINAQRGEAIGMPDPKIFRRLAAASVHWTQISNFAPVVPVL